MNESNLNRMIREHKARIIWFLVFLILAVFVTALVFGTLKRSVQAQTYTKRVFACPYAQEGAEPVAHQHNDDCYENGELICTLPERELHIHGDECYTEEKVLVCTLEESEGHIHTDACYTEEPVLVCGLEENDGHVHSVENGCYTRVQGELICTDEDPEHVHTDDCYTWEEVLTCEIPEGEGAHHHSEECYEMQRVLSCGKEEGEGAHTHDDTCYEINKVLICDKEEVKTEHVHTVDCFQVTDMSPEEIHALHMSELPESDPDADVESPDVWESRFASVPLSGHWDRDLLKIAETQLGYTESQRNFEAVPDEYGDGYTLKGWTRYGAWYGIPYGDWCAMFISFCLNYADIPESAIPYDCATTTWIDSLSARGMYAPAGSYDPKPGDLIFFDWEGDGLSDHVGIVWAVNPNSITTIEGNHTISVELFDYDRYDGHIQGYGILPENPALAADDSDENQTTDEEGANGGDSNPTAGTSDTSINNNRNSSDPQDAEPTVNMPPFSYSERVAGMRVSIEADEGAFPEGTTVTIKPIEDDNLAEQVAPAISGQVVKVQAVDITFFDADGNEIEPRIPIRVTMRPFTETEADNVGVVHVGSDGVVSAVDTQNDVAQPDQGIAFNADSFSTYALVYTVTFACDADGNVYQYSMPGGTGLSLRELLIDLGMKSEYNVDSYLSHVVNVAFSKPDCMTLTKEENDWLLQSVHAFDTSESLTVTFDDYSMLAIPVTVSGIEQLDLENASISSADGVFLPEDTEGHAIVVEDASETISAVEEFIDSENKTPEKPTVIETLQSLLTLKKDEQEDGEKVYQVFDIGLNTETINTGDYQEGFNVEVKLPERVVGKDFHLYHVHGEGAEQTVEEIVDFNLKSSTVETGSDLVTGFSFQTDSFSPFVLSYTVDFEYQGHKWSFPGFGSYSVSSIMSEIGVAGEISDVSLECVEGTPIDGALYLTRDGENEWWLNSDLAFNDVYELTAIVDGAAYVITVTDDQGVPYTIEFEFYDEKGDPVSPTTFTSNYYLFTTDPAVNNQSVIKNYYKFETLSLNGSATKTITYDVFNIGNGNPNGHPHASGEDVTVELLTSPDGAPNVDQDQGTYQFQSNYTWSKIEDGSIAGGYVFTITTESDKTTFTGRKPQPYQYTINTTDGVEIGFDDIYANNWYLVSALVKADGTGTYQYVTPVALDEETSVSGSIPLYYTNSNLSNISISNPGAQSSTTTSAYVDGDTVNTFLVHMNSTPSNYNEVISLASETTSNGEAYKNGDGANCYTVNITYNAGNSVITLKKAAVPTITVQFLDENGVTGEAPLLDNNTYYLYVKLDRGRGKADYGYITQIDINTPSKNYTIPYFYGATEATASDRAYLTDGRSYSAYVLYRHDSEPTLAAVDSGTGMILYEDGDLIEDTVLDSSAVTSVSATATSVNGTLKITELPTLKISSQFADSESNHDNYYLLVTMTDTSGKKYYALKDVSADSTAVGAFQTSPDDGKSYYYTGEETIAVSVIVPTNNNDPTLSDAVTGNNCNVFATGAVTGDGYKISSSHDTDTETVSVALDKLDITPDDFNVVATFYDKKNSETVLSPLSSELTGSYYLLMTVKSEDQEIAYAVTGVTEEQLAAANSSGTLSVIVPASTQYKMLDANGKELSSTIQYDPTLFTMSTRLYSGSYVPNTYEQAKAGNDTITGYDFWDNTLSADHKSTQIRLYSAYSKIYKVQLDLNQAGTVTPDDALTIKVEAQHATTGLDVFKGNVEIINDSTLVFEIEDQTTGVQHWTERGNSSNTFSGNEDVTITLLRNGQAIAQGGLALDYQVDYNTERKETYDDATKVTTIVDHVTLTKVSASHDYDYYSILGDGVGYGITADYLAQYGHIQSNFATNFYYGNNIIEPDLAGHGAVIVIADFELNQGKALEIGGSHVDGTDTIVYLGNGGTLDLIKNVADRPWVHVIPSSTEDLTNNVVDPIINHMETISAELLTHETTIHPTPNVENKMYIDLLDFSQNATIYLDGDELNHWVAKGNNGLYITKHKEQMIVFNFDSTDEVTIGQYHVRYAEGEDSNYYVSEADRFKKSEEGYFHSYSPTGKGHSDNEFADYLAQHVVFNLASAKKIYTAEAVGMVLIPREDSTMEITATSAGWVISDGYVTNKAGHEWHSVYAEMPDSTTTDLTVFKTVDDRTPGAHQKFYFNLEHLITTSDSRHWNRLRSEVMNTNRAVKFSSISEMEIGWNVYRITEDSENIPDVTVGSYRMDSRKIYAFVRYFNVGGNVNVAGTPRYYIEALEDEAYSFIFNDQTFNPGEVGFEDAIGTNADGVRLKAVTVPTLTNTTRRDGLEIKKKVTGSSNENARFNFKVEIWLETRDDQHKIFEDTSDTTKSYPMSGVEGQTSIEFTKRVAPNGVDEYAVAAVQLKAGQAAFITGIPATAQYKVTELSTVADITYVPAEGEDPNTAKNAPIAFNAENKSNGYTNADREKTGVIVENDASVAEFTNAYEATGEYIPNVFKTMLGRTMAAGEFSFVIKEGNEPVATGTIPESPDGIPAKIQWTPEKLTFNQNHIGQHTFTYTIQEITDGMPEGVGVLGESSYDLVLEVVDNFDGTLTVNRLSPAESDGAFVNTLKAEQTLVGTKELTGRDLTEGEFTFEAKLTMIKQGQTTTQITDENRADVTIVAPATVEGTNAAATMDGTTLKATGTITFPAITFFEEGEYTFEVTEDTEGLPSGVTAVSPAMPFAVTVTVVKTTNAQGKEVLTPTVQYPAEYTFINTWEGQFMNFSVTKEWKREGVEVFAPRTITFSVTQDGTDFDLTNVTIEKTGEGSYSVNGNTVTLTAGASGWPTVQFKNVPQATYVVTETNHTVIPSENTFSTSYALNNENKASNNEAAATQNGDVVLIKNAETIPNDNRAQLTLKKIWDNSVAQADRQTVTYELYQVPASGTSGGGGSNQFTIDFYGYWGLAASTTVYYENIGEEVSVIINNPNKAGEEYTVQNNNNGNININKKGIGPSVQIDFSVTDAIAQNGLTLYDYSGDSTKFTGTTIKSGGSVPLIVEDLTTMPATHAIVTALGGTKYGEYTLEQSQWDSGITVSVPKKTGTTTWQYYVVEKDGDSYGATYTRDGDSSTLIVTNNTTPALKLKIVKVDAKTQKPLAGAVFTLTQLNEKQQPTANGTMPYMVPEVQYVSDATGSGTNGAGETVIQNLKPGYYEVKETAVPDGYILTSDSTFYIKIDQDGNVLQLSPGNGTPETWSTSSVGFDYVLSITAVEVENPASITVKNMPGTELPKTGGPGTALYSLLGGMMVVTAGAVLTLRRKKNKA